MHRLPVRRNMSRSVERAPECATHVSRHLLDPLAVPHRRAVVSRQQLMAAHRPIPDPERRGAGGDTERWHGQQRATGWCLERFNRQKEFGLALGIQADRARSRFLPLRVEMQPFADRAWRALLEPLHDDVPHVPAAYRVYARPAFGQQPAHHRQPSRQRDSALHEGGHPSSERIHRHAGREPARRI